jgi:predicted DNA-binding antitoxin AbrB/MazE fold protein
VDWVAKRITIAAKYENGVFKPLEDVKIEEGVIVQVYVPQAEKAKPQSIRDLGFTGMWAERNDITDGVSYVNRLRNNPRG